MSWDYNVHQVAGALMFSFHVTHENDLWRLLFRPLISHYSKVIHKFISPSYEI